MNIYINIYIQQCSPAASADIRSPASKVARPDGRTETASPPCSAAASPSVPARAPKWSFFFSSWNQTGQIPPSSGATISG